MLPISSFIGSIVNTVGSHAVTIVTAPTGAGKSTVVPDALEKQGYSVVCTQPRRLAAVSLADRVASLRGEPLGQSVGFKTAHEGNFGFNTRLLYVTDGLEVVSRLVGAKAPADVLVIDEVHEWNLNVEVLLGWARYQLAKGASFKIVVMSATMDSRRLSEYFNGAPIVEVQGRVFPITEQAPSSSLEHDVANLVNQGRNVLVFQPGKGEIATCIESLQRQGVNADLIPLHGELSVDEQRRAFSLNGRPMVVVSTNVAQTSVTIPHVDAVVDSGYIRQVEFRDGVEGLYTVTCSTADREQRKGRAGRTKPGIYIDHCRVRDEARDDYPTPEIQRVDLAMAMLRLQIRGFRIEEFELVHQPPADSIKRAKHTLWALGCLDQDQNVTDIGYVVSQLPLSPSAARMIVEALKLRGRQVMGLKHRVLDDLFVIAGILEVGGITNRKSRAWRQFVPRVATSDLLVQLEVFRQTAGMSGQELREHGVFAKDRFRVMEVQRQLRKRLAKWGLSYDSDGDEEGIRRCILVGKAHCLTNCQLQFPDEFKSFAGISSRQQDDASQVQLRTGKAYVGVPFDLALRFGTLNLFNLLTEVPLEWLRELVPHLVRLERGSYCRYNPLTDQVEAEHALKLVTGVTLADSMIDDPEHPGATQAFASWMAQVTLSPHAEVPKCLEGLIAYNRELLATKLELHRRSGGAVESVPDMAELRQFYAERLGTARSCKEVVAVDKLRLSIDQATIKAVDESCPESVLFEGLGLLPVSYSGGSPSVKLVILPEQAAQVYASLPGELPSVGGRSVLFAVEFNGFTRRFNTVDELRKFLLREVQQVQFDSWSKPALRPLQVTKKWRSPNKQPPLMIRREFGHCPITGLEIVAFAVAVARFCQEEVLDWKWFLGLDEAEALFQLEHTRRSIESTIQSQRQEKKPAKVLSRGGL